MRTLVERSPILLWAGFGLLLWGGVALTGDGGPVPSAGVAVNVLGGLVFGLVLGVLSQLWRRRRDRTERAVLAGLAPEQQRLAGRAATRGPVPADPRVAAAAAELAVRELAERDRTTTSFLVGGCAGLGLSMVLALTAAGIFWCYAGLLAAGLASTLWWPGHLRRRVATLRARA